MKYADFSLRTRQVPLPEPVCDTTSIHRAALTMLDRFGLDDGLFRVRLTGVGAAGLVEGPPPKLLFDDDGRARRHKLETVAAAIAGKFEGVGLRRATQLESDESRTHNAAATTHKRISPKERDR